MRSRKDLQGILCGIDLFSQLTVSYKQSAEGQRYIVLVAAPRQQAPFESSTCAVEGLPTSFPALSPG